MHSDNPWIIVAFSRPQFLQNLVKNNSRQIVKPRLVIVENGQAIGCCDSHGFKPDKILQCQSTVIGTVRNVGIDYAKSVDPNAPLGFWDDDDVYGSRYIQEALDVLINRNLGLTMKQYHLIRLASEQIYLCDPNDAESSNTPNGILGATAMVRHAYMSPKMKDVSREEDTHWGKEILASGADFLTTSFKNFCHVRHNNNITKKLMDGDNEVLHTFVKNESWLLVHSDVENVVEMQSLEEITSGGTINIVPKRTRPQDMMLDENWKQKIREQRLIARNMINKTRGM